MTGWSELETTARNLTLLGFLVEEEYPPQDSQATLRAKRQKLKANFLKPGTPKGMQDKDLDARNGDYTRGVLALLGSGLVAETSNTIRAVQAR